MAAATFSGEIYNAVLEKYSHQIVGQINTVNGHIPIYLLDLNRYFHAALTKNFTYHMPYYRFGGGASYFSQREKLYAIVIEAAINQNMRYSCFTINNSIGCSYPGTSTVKPPQSL